MSKLELRKQVIAQRNTLTKQNLQDLSTAIVTKFLDLPEYRQAATVMAYADFRNEVQTAQILENTLRQNKRLVLPVTDVSHKKLIPSQVLHYPQDLTPGTWGILEPSSQCMRPVDPREIDLVIVPGVAFDTMGNRLGYGGGFYDRFLPCTSENTTLVALAFELQVRSDVYPGEHDVPVHILVTEERVLHFRNNQQ
ncbi:putative 5-formyltetrahydrofolate cyclo-ligase [Sporotomaculum syntrophicum]|uniref:5-formyltetrahydrofolate cyclo-ligase n=1 Tax=Sporotomaculum syntrophicum TaxID=182264 RepID=A0A9D2WQQ0_9FIRM|nr:5-formyltetrahydrofolate cyclo-ligase [Sporotomaculum syntrophicum]KAF1085370.1 putative 5-formyltetrahydrofolate cyclo-ligase [Sporotomaculum syntrophicum]